MGEKSPPDRSSPGESPRAAVRAHYKAVASIVLPVAILVALIMATGAGNPFARGHTVGSTPPAQPKKNSSVRVAQVIHAKLTVTKQQLRRGTWLFTYTLRNSGSVPVAGVQLDSARANLYDLKGPSTWAVFGSGVCGGHYPGFLIYWSTGTTSPSVLHPGETAHFGFRVNTDGVKSMVYSLSWKDAVPQFGTTLGPAPSKRPISGPCK